ncbi:hypothetical protein EDB81DRAFT_222710 [Dactylonectria macrodidyma]|uniref:Uncharacterized protein n=1 Tax=Dactylonectria macrodidyma TaxID=307937 RepID=A0A9P9DPH4_9HYPO|nr:hypothetical protein EDB81DRAFT_222710 [Dactylonectria macrodidyma]
MTMCCVLAGQLGSISWVFVSVLTLSFPFPLHKHPFPFPFPLFNQAPQAACFRGPSPPVIILFFACFFSLLNSSSLKCLGLLRVAHMISPAGTCVRGGGFEDDPVDLSPTYQNQKGSPSLQPLLSTNGIFT